MRVWRMALCGGVLAGGMVATMPAQEEPRDQRPAGERREGERRPDGERGPEGGPRDGERRPEGFRGEGRPMNPLFQAIDADHDGEISAAELEKAAAALKGLDKNSDGKITLEEARPEFSREGRGDFGREGGRFGGPQGGPGGPAPNSEEIMARYLSMDANKDGKLSKDELPERIQGLLTRADTDSDGVVSKEELSQLVARQMEAARNAPVDSVAPADPVAAQVAPAEPVVVDPGGFGPPNPEMFVNRAMEFDADKDGKLSKEELTKMAEQFGRGGGERGERGVRPEGDRPRGDRPEGPPSDERRRERRPSSESPDA